MRNALLFALLLAGCHPPLDFHGEPYHFAPGPYRGEAGVHVDPSIGVGGLCVFRMYPVGQPDPGGNWLRVGQTISTTTALFVQPGRYHVVADSCGLGRPEQVVHFEQDVSITGPTSMEVEFDSEMNNSPTDRGDVDRAMNRPLVRLVAPTPAWYVALQQYMAAHPEQQSGQPNCNPDGQDVTGSPDMPCCSGSRHSVWDGVGMHEYCGPSGGS